MTKRNYDSTIARIAGMKKPEKATTTNEPSGLDLGRVGTIHKQHGWGR